MPSITRLIPILNPTRSRASQAALAVAEAGANPNMPFWSLDAGLSSTGVDDLSGQNIGLQGESPWLYNTPGGIYNMLHWISKRYNAPEIYITENGCSEPHESTGVLPDVLDDRFRVAYYFEYLENVAAAITDGVKIKGYFAWSLLDNFEWADGYQMRFGLHYVDYADPDLPRYPKSSAKW